MGARLAWAAAALLLLGSRPAAADVPVVELAGVVHAVSAAHVRASLAAAEQRQAPLVILRLDTPGGLDGAMRQVVEAILRSPVPVAAFVGPAGARAASAGFVILLAADVAAMAPGTNTGAAHPLALGAPASEVAAHKAASDLAAYVRSKAEPRGRDAALAEKAVLESRSFTDREALEAGLVDLVVPEEAALLARLDGRELRRFDGSRTTLHLQGQRLVVQRMGRRQALLAVIAQPDLMFLLLLGALAGLGAELSHPGALFPGLVGTVCLVLFLFASQVLPVSAAGVLLVALAFGLFVAEAKVASHGLLGSFGLLSMVLGASMLVDAPDPGLGVPLPFLLPAALVLGAGTLLLARAVLRARRRRPAAGDALLLGQRGEAACALEPTGWVRVRGERWQARSEEPVPAGGAVVVVAREGFVLQVKKEG